jgi:phosphoglycolate phosphatase
MEKRMEKILVRFPQEDGFRRALGRAVGYDVDARRIAPGGPLAVATREQTQKIVIDFLSRQGIPQERAEGVVRESFHLADLEIRLDELIRPMDGLPSLLRAFKDKRVSIACLTNDEHRRARAILEFLNIADFFQLIMGGDEVKHPKPDPEMIESACKRLRLVPRQIAYIGDTVTDMIMAKTAGAGLAVGVLGGAASESLLAGEADVVIPNLEAISVAQNH